MKYKCEALNTKNVFNSAFNLERCHFEQKWYNLWNKLPRKKKGSSASVLCQPSEGNREDRIGRSEADHRIADKMYSQGTSHIVLDGQTETFEVWEQGFSISC